MDRKVNAGFAFALAVFLLIGVVSLLSEVEETESTQSVVRTHAVIIELEATLSTLKDIEGGSRGYALTGNENFLEPYNAAIATLSQRIEHLRQLTWDEPAQKVRISFLESRADRKVAFAQKVVAVRKVRGLQAAQEQVSGSEGEILMDEIRALVGQMAAEEYGVLRRRTEEQMVNDRRTTLARVTTVAAALALCLVFYFIRRDLKWSRKAQEGLRQSEDRYRRLFESNPQPMWVYDLETLAFLAVNDAAIHHYGYAREEFLRMTIKDIRPPEDIPALLRCVTRGSDGIDAAGVWRHRKKDGTIIEADITSHPLTFAGRRAELVLAIDVTQRARAERALRLSEQRFSKAFDASPEPMSISTLSEGRYLDVNECFLRTTGYRREEVVGLTSEDLKFWSDSGLRPRMVDALVERGPVRDWEIEFTTKTGDVRTGLLSGEVIHVDGQPCLLAVTKDITERKQAERALERLRVAVDASGEVVFMTDREGIITFINRQFVQLYGYEGEEVIGKVTPRLLKSGELKPEDYASFWEKIRSGKVVRGEVINRTKGGRMVTVESSVNPIRDERGEIVGFLAIQRDVTERKRLEEQFRQAQKMEAVGRLAGGVAHDFNNLLTIISGYSDLLLEGLEPGDSMHAQMNQIRQAANRAAALTRQLLAFSRRQVLVPQVVNLSSIVTNMEQMLRRLIGEDVVLTTNLPPEVGLVKADPGQIEQIILNLAVNARDAMPQGGRLTIEIQNVELDQAFARNHVGSLPGPCVLLAVSDTGCGMDAETRSHIFEPFFTTKDPDKGTGLGLATVYGIVKQSGGYISVYSELGHGTTFKIYLPRAAAPGELHPPEKSLNPSVRGSETVLVVEDEAAVRSLVEKALGANGYEVLTASNGKEALEVSGRHEGQVHLLLTDVVMPGMSGPELAEHMASLRGEMRVMYMSGYTDEAIVNHGVLDANAAFIQKPFTPESLARKVHSILHAPLAASKPTSID